MENANETKKNDTVEVTYKGTIYIITLEEFNNLKEGYTTFKEMFD